MRGRDGENEKAVAEVGYEKDVNERAVAENWRENTENGTRTPRFRAPVGTPGEQVFGDPTA